MTKDEALRLALEALEKVTKQMLAIRDELAERGGRPTNNFVHEELWDSSFDVYINCAIPTAEAIKAALEAKDEPVGTAGELFTNTALERLDLRPSTGIYITPSQRKPLTLEQLREHCKVAKVFDMTYAEIDIADYVLIARDVEALHNIKENT